MANTAAKPNLNVRLLIDKEKNKVVFAEAGKDFVDVLCSLLTLPMGTIVRLLEKHQKTQSSIVGCFRNLYKSVSTMDIDSFVTGSCKNLLMYPRSVYEIESNRRKLKLNIDDSEATKFFLCKYFVPGYCCSFYSNLSRTRCSSCGSLMTREIQVEEEQASELVLSCGTSFIITDDLKVASNSTGHVFNVLNDLGYDGFEKLQEMLVDVGFHEVVTLLGCLFTSEAPLTDTFLSKDIMKGKRKMSKALVQESIVASARRFLFFGMTFFFGMTRGRGSDKLITIKAYVRKADNVILFAECREDFVDFLFTFLAIPLELVWELSIDTANKGCVGNLCRSLKELRVGQHGKSHVDKCRLPYYYNIQAQLLCVDVEEVPEYELLINNSTDTYGKLSKNIQLVPSGHRILKLNHMDSNVKVASVSARNGFLKGQSKFLVSDAMVVTPIKACSTISMLSKLNVRISDIEEQVISLGKSEAISLLRGSLCTTSALNNGLSSFLSKLKPTKATGF